MSGQSESAQSRQPPPAGRPRRSFVQWVNSTSRRTFLVLPILVVLAEATIQGDVPAVTPWGIPLMAWGYLQFRLGGNFRSRRGGGGPGIDVPPERIVDTGIYAYIRNPMYLGHMIFLAGLAITLRSWIVVGLLAVHAVWFERRVREDEARLEELFGEAYRDYLARTRRWIPFVY